MLENRVPEWASVAAGRVRPWSLLTGAPTGGSVPMMRFRWIASTVNRDPASPLRYELFKPWRRYDAVIFLKSMGAESAALAKRLRLAGTRVIFDLNVDYLTPAEGRFHYPGMAPTAVQHDAAHEMLRLSDAVIADSSHLASIAARHHAAVHWIPDNVDMGFVPANAVWKGSGKLPLLWSGESVKLFDLLKIEGVLRDFARDVKLTIVTSAMTGLDRWEAAERERFEKMLAAIEHEIISFRSIPRLFEIYRRGGVVISPRFLDNSYNLGHTEWKLTLAMACGRRAIGSPVASYCDVERLAGGKGIRICHTDAEWSAVLSEHLADPPEVWAAEELSARDVVETNYSTAVVARRHRELLEKIIDRP